MTHVLRPALHRSLRRSVTAAGFAVLMALGSVAPSLAQPAAVTPVTASATSVLSSTSVLSATTLASSRSNRAGAGRAAARRALSQVGKRYKWGATGPSSYDCSGLTRNAWRAAGVKIPRTARAQANSLYRVSRSNLRPGDLVFFGSPVSHVEMYTGNGRLVGASRSKGAVSTSRLSNRSNVSGYGRP